MHPILEGLFRQHPDAEVMLADLSEVSERVKSGATRQPDVMTELSRLRRERGSFFYMSANVQLRALPGMLWQG
jgi:hypothetical protein